MALRQLSNFALKPAPIMSQLYARNCSGEWGSGAGKGGGAGGSIRDAGGSFGKMEVAREEEYFRKMQAEQLHKLKDHMDDEIEYHEKQIKRHAEAISKFKEKIKKLED